MIDRGMEVEQQHSFKQSDTERERERESDRKTKRAVEQGECIIANEGKDSEKQNYTIHLNVLQLKRETERGTREGKREGD